MDKELEARGDVWVGTEASYEAARDVAQKVAQRMQVQTDGTDPYEPPSMLVRHGQVGVISIKGSLINSDNPLYAFFGVPTYGRIREAIVEAASDPEVKTILLDIDSGGGQVSGVADTADLISVVDQSVKPIYAYTDGNMCSGAYWLGCSAREVYASQTAELGSIGVITVLMDYADAMEKEGVKANIIRAGKYKQAGNPYEHLSDEMRAQIQARVDAVYKIFVTHVATQRRRSFEYADTVMAQGRVFMAAAARDASLVDGISNFDTLFAGISSSKVDISTNSLENTAIGADMGTKNNKKPLTEAIRQALAGSGELTPLAQALAASQEVVTAAVPTAPTAVTEAAGAVEPAEAVVVTAVVDAAQVQAQLADVQAQMQTLTAENERLSGLLEAATADGDAARTQVAEVSNTLTSLLPVVVKSVNAMQVALGGHAQDLSAATASEVLTVHKLVAADFQKNFKVGGIAAVTPNSAASAEKVQSDSLRAARLAAVRL